jgi:hypothetical protein
VLFAQELRLAVKSNNIKLAGAVKLQRNTVLKLPKITIKVYKALDKPNKGKLDQRHLIKQQKFQRHLMKPWT